MKYYKYTVTVHLSMESRDLVKKAIDKLIRDHLHSISIATQEPERLINSYLQEGRS